jgi:1-deoxy-D-xylulose-5-phosphate reductoisomerase
MNMTASAATMTPAGAPRQRLAVLGSTGSIGVSTLEVVALHPERFEVVGLSANRRLDVLLAQCRALRPRVAVLPDQAQAARFRQMLHAEGLPTQVMGGAQALCELAAAEDVDSVMAAIVGAAGLPACVAAARAGKRLLLANKEALVVGGAMFMNAVEEGGATLLPIDSEHSAIFQCLPEDPRTWAQRLDHIVLTASGGPFRQRDHASLVDVTPAQAVAHPNWTMGRKISVDSATMMNKALEVIEARWLFGLAPDNIRVVIHPQSIIHSMVVCRDASVLAQLGTPDMKVPIAYGLAHPERIEAGAQRLDFTSLKALTFEEPQERHCPGLFLAWDALRGPAGTTTVLNAANEEAVAAFLDGTIGFTSIHTVNARAIERLRPDLGETPTLEALLDLDQRARRLAQELMKNLKPHAVAS